MKLKGFTLVEMLVAMTISLIVLSASFIGYRTVTALYNRYSTQLHEINELQKLNTLLTLDAQISEIITGSTTSMLCFTNYKYHATYISTGAYTIRTQTGVSDTFHCAKNLSCTISEVNNATQLQFSFTNNRVATQWVVYKEYSPDIAINKTLSESR